MRVSPCRKTHVPLHTHWEYSVEVARIERFRNDRVARYFAEEHGGEYMGWIDNPTVFTVKRNDEAITKTDDGAYIVIWKEENK